MPKRRTKEEFISEVIKIWGDRFDLSEAKYVNNKTNITVTCNVCGCTFHPKPDNLLRKHGCPRCANNEKLTKEQFIERATKLHNGKYNYDNVIFESRLKKVAIVCPIHGVFYQTPKMHLRYQGCRECAKLTMGSERLSLSDFVERANKIHGNKYGYEKISGFRNNRQLVKIRCPHHGFFLQTPHAHLSGNGCPICKESKGEKRVAKHLDSLNVKYQRQAVFKTNLAPGNRHFFKVDFYLPKYNLIIEFNGYQHYFENGWFSNKNPRFHFITKRDESLRVFCSKNNINLLEIPFSRIKETESLIDEKLLGIKELSCF